VELRNDRLYEALTAYYQRARGVVARTRAECGNEQFADVRPEFRVAPGGAMSRFYSVEPDWSRVVRRSEDRLRELKEYRSLVEALTTDETIAPQLEGHISIVSYYPWVRGAGQCVESLLIGLLCGQKGGFEQAAFDEFYQGVERLFYSDTLEVRCVAPLGGFEMDADRIELDEGFVIARIPDSERAEMLSESAAFAPFAHPSPIGLRKHGLELRVQLRKHVAVGDAGAADSSWKDPHQKASEAFTEACSAMRLFKRGDVGFDQILSHLTCWHPFGGKMRTGPMDTRQFFAGTYTLSKAEVSDFRSFWEEYRGATELDIRKVGVALRRFNLGYTRREREDRLIDYVVGLESLLVESPGELRYRFALRGAALLGGSADSRQAVRELLEAAYNARNDIVHGSKVRATELLKIGKDGRKLAFAEVVDTIEEYLRRGTKEYLIGRRGETKESILQHLESAIVRGLGHRRKA
jgi:hypothetical protein